MQQDRDSGSPLPTGQRRIHSPTTAAFFPRFGGLRYWEKAGSGRRHQTRVALSPTLHVWKTVRIFENPFLSKAMFFENLLE